MMPPVTPLPIPSGDVVPYPGSALDLGGGKWLLMTGKVVTQLRGQRICSLSANTLKYWEAAALRGQNGPLSQMMG